MADRMHLEGMPLFASGHAPDGLRLDAGTGFWPAIDRLSAEDRVAEQLDDLLAGASSPRTWLVLHEPGEPQLSCMAALMLARALGERGQNVLVLDIDEAEASLTRWADRDETEGWIDVARFGASVSGAGVPLPFRGGRGTLLGIGSFRPTDATDGEIISLIGRLRHQGDDIVLVGAVGPAVVPWAKLAARRLLCWDPSLRAADHLAGVSRPFAASGVPLTGLIAFGDVVAAPVARDVDVAVAAATDADIDVAAATGHAAAPVAGEPVPVTAAPDIAAEEAAGEEIAGDDIAAEEPAADDADADEAIAADAGAQEIAALAEGEAAGDAATGDGTEDAASDSAPGDPEPTSRSGADLPPAAVATPVGATRESAPPLAPGHDADLGLGGESEAPRGTPRVFWLATGVFVVALMAVAWYWSEYVRVPPGGYFAPVVTGDDGKAARRDSTAGRTGDTKPGPVANPGVGQVAEAGGLTSSDDSLSEVRRRIESGAAKPEPAKTATVPAVPAPAPAGGGTSPSTPAGLPAVAPFDRAAYGVPAGQAGWALHVYSVPDSAGAVKECAGLERAGFKTAVRIVEIKEKGGRWWRIYVGSFPSRKAALAAMPALLVQLKADWAEPAPLK